MTDDDAHHHGAHDHGGAGHGGAGHGGAGHGHGVAPDADRRYLTGALALIVAFLITEVVVGLIAGSLALITDAGHMLTDAASILLALIAIRLSAKPARGRWTYGYKRAEILSAQANGLTLLLLAVWFVYEGIHRLIEPPTVQGLLVFGTALVGIVVNIAAAWLISKANRTSLNVEGAFQHILNDLYAFIATAIAGLVVAVTGFARADAIAALLVAALMIKAGYGLVRDSGRIFLEGAPAGLDPDLIGPAMAARPGVEEVHDLHIWDVTSGMPALSAHVLVDPGGDCHAVRRDLEILLRGEYRIEHTTLQVDHIQSGPVALGDLHVGEDCVDPHGVRHQSAGPQGGREVRQPH
ncbi:cobalt-zinc-cadmium efflux system protein [Nakamurella panacisegetis]|uniref:Cobalt-zinc-cadmium efflux system protein n=1 Tax=Nakamurella panacisegetis TaxID=1090615 RepID=A0A1H0KWX1_9ACTN|nr:cation diffusion facilitator family transporter [Nakamurella panacisegetis]SDO60467.1 cobalt-zinc-cadmium efflux system protein [Nakamurella panacisegetis]